MFRRDISSHFFLALVACLLTSAPSDARVIRKHQDEQRLIGWLGEVPREASGEAVDGGGDGLGGRKHGPKDVVRDVVHEIFTEEGADTAKVFTDADEEGVGEAGFENLNADGFMNLDSDPRIEKLSDTPLAYLYRNFLTEQECDHLVTVGEPHLTRSTVVGDEKNTNENDGLTNDVRTSFGTFIPKNYDETFFGVEQRVSRFSNLPYENQEQLQLLRYRDGQEYKDHSDGLTSPNGGKRVATVLMFLKEPDVGGETCFPMATPFEGVKQRLKKAHDMNILSECAWRSGKGMAVQPRKGDAILFFSFRKDKDGVFAISDPQSTHASCPTFGGTKWTATKWIHEYAFETGVWKEPKCEDAVPQCPTWAKNGECARNPGFMLGVEVAGKCVKSCCEGVDGVEENLNQNSNSNSIQMPAQLSAWQLEFCASCAGTKYVGEFAKMRAQEGVK